MILFTKISMEILVARSINLSKNEPHLAYEESEAIPNEDAEANFTASIHNLHFKWKETKDITSGGIL